MSKVQEFCELVRKRSSDNRLALQRLDGLSGHQVGILREELDSMIRVIWLLRADAVERERLAVSVLELDCICDANGRRITDRQMVDLAEGLHNWTKRVYKFGCAFIHLSSFHRYEEEDPFKKLSVADRNEVRGHLSNYHSYALPPDFGFSDIVPVLPKVFEKIASNLAYYIDGLERGEPRAWLAVQ